MSRAGSDLMDMLHGLVATALTDELQQAMDLASHEDPEKRQPINPQLIDKALKFLKDNSITAPASNKPMSDLSDQLRDLDLDQEALRLPN